ncbi:LicD family-domain-containing protein [Dendryphion nanum]|uniref:LicD family-domain-containing protein n=1 Tax=Dendryphion nanum TaxID=256645 RepID=A0A9P9DLG0_9PLEO|nr:LicD family-domain-containing protein [Dendryphion nanum]
MHFPTLELALICLTHITSALPTAPKQIEDFNNLHGLTHMERDLSGTEYDPEGKYFHESMFHQHYDGRFGSRPLTDEDRISNLTALAQTYLSTMTALNIQTWIMHGSLLGWYWNRRIMPWDTDIDVQIGESSIKFLGDYYNMTVHHFELSSDGSKPPRPTSPSASSRSYLLEINPNYVNASTEDYLNVIDARWIDTATGLFIDMTTLRRNASAEEEGEKGSMMCKDKHHYMHEDIFPLRSSTFEGAPVLIPYRYSGLLTEEYGDKALTETVFEEHYFDEDRKEWMPFMVQQRVG